MKPGDLLKMALITLAVWLFFMYVIPWFESAASGEPCPDDTYRHYGLTKDNVPCREKR